MKNWIRSKLRRNWRPIAVPHYLIVNHGGLSGSPDWQRTLALCDGSRTLDEVSELSGISQIELIRQSHDGMLLLWPDPPRVWPDPPRAATEKLAQIIIVSPHLDDAALSLGGHMLQWKEDCLVLDVFSEVSWWRFPYKYKSPNDSPIQITRLAEEQFMAKLVGCGLAKMGFLEAPRRGYSLENLFTAEISAQDSETREAIRVALQAFIHDGEPRWFLPLGVGNHVDHRLARDTALAALLRANVPPQRIRFYEDLFYAAQSPGIPDFTSFIPGHRLKLAEQTPIDVKMKSRLLQVYGSQLTWSQIRMVQEYAHRFGSRPIERCWELA